MHSYPLLYIKQDNSQEGLHILRYTFIIYVSQQASQGITNIRQLKEGADKSRDPLPEFPNQRPFPH